jgi:hypothetical protein
MEDKKVDRPPQTFMTAAKEYFGLLPGQKTMDFGQEVKALTPEARAEMTEELKRAGYNISN